MKQWPANDRVKVVFDKNEMGQAVYVADSDPHTFDRRVVATTLEGLLALIEALEEAANEIEMETLREMSLRKRIAELEGLL